MIDEATTFVLVHSPFLGPLSWRAVETALNKRGEASQLLDLRDALSVEDHFYEAFGTMAARRIGEPSILVAHSGAGALVPTILGQVGDLARGVIFVDALLPHPSRSWFDTAPGPLAKRLRGTAHADRAPAWPSWAPKEVLKHLLPDRLMRESLVQSALAVPLAYLEETAPALFPPAPPRGYGYLQLSAGYDVEADQARALGWPVERLNANHLSMMTEPDLIAEAIGALAARLPL